MQNTYANTLVFAQPRVTHSPEMCGEGVDFHMHHNILEYDHPAFCLLHKMLAAGAAPQKTTVRVVEKPDRCFKTGVSTHYSHQNSGHNNLHTVIASSNDCGMSIQLAAGAAPQQARSATMHGASDALVRNCCSDPLASAVLHGRGVLLEK